MASPDTLPGLSAWWRADSLALGNADPVSSWPDSGPNAFTATQATTSLRPTFRTDVLNGRPVVRFDGGDRLVSAASSSLAATTLYVVVLHNDAAIVPIRATSGDGGIIFQTRSGVMAWSAQNTGLRRDGGDTPGGVFNILSASLDSAGSAFFLNGTPAGTGQGLTPTAGRTTIIGSDPVEVGEALTGDIGDLIVYSQVHTAAQRAEVHSFLQDKYAIAVADYIAPPAGTPAAAFLPFFQ